MSSTAAFVDSDSLDPTLQNVLKQTTLKWIFVGGKGGVGKTTTSCSLSIQLASVRESVLIISTDPAHNLSDAFRQKFTKHPTLVNGFTNLYAMEVDPNPDTGDIAALGEEYEEAGSFFQDISSSIPGIDEAMSFAEVMKQVQSMDYSAIVFDTAPTGHTLRLLQFPTTLEKGLSKLMSLKDSFGGALSSVSRLLGAQGAEDTMEQMVGKFTQLKEVVEEVNKQFKDPDLTTFICVCIPEFLSLYETERLVQELAKFEIDSRNIVINQIVFPEEVGTSRLLKSRVKMQQKYMDQFFDLYEDFHIVLMPLLEEEVRGPEALKAFSKNLIVPYKPKPADNRDEVAVLKARIAELEAQLNK
jgi:arsenite/tail-anchored protein-transporting ATPase